MLAPICASTRLIVLGVGRVTTEIFAYVNTGRSLLVSSLLGHPDHRTDGAMSQLELVRVSIAVLQSVELAAQR